MTVPVDAQGIRTSVAAGDLHELIGRLRGDELRSIENDVSTGLRDQILKALDERGRAQELVRQQYSGRYPFELLQNANDASADVGGGAVCFLLTDAALIVADQGTGFGEDQIRAICGLGRSSKDPRKSIGYKGLGFKSVGEISDRPQVVSTAVSFGFDEARARKAVEEVLADTLDPTQRLPVYAFPFAVTGSDFGEDECAVSELQARGFSTVLRFPFHSRATRHNVARQVSETLTPRLLLFLDATDSLEVTGTESDFIAEVARSEEEGCIETLLQVGDLVEHWLVYHRSLGDVDRALVDPLGDAWRLVEEVQVAVAVRLDENGRPVHATPEPVHVYFPTEETTGIPAILQGDFALELDRRHASRTPETTPYNEWLGSELAALVGEVAEHLAKRFPRDAAVVGAFAPSGRPSDGFGERLVEKVRASLRASEFVPSVNGDTLSPPESLLLSFSLPRPVESRRFLDLGEHPAAVIPELEAHLPSRRLLSEMLGARQLSTEATLNLLSEPAPSDETDFYEWLVDWSEEDGGRRFAGILGKVPCVRTIGGGWVTPASGVFFPRQREEVSFPTNLQVPICAVPDLEGLRPLLEAAGVRPFEWRLLIPDFVMPLLQDDELDPATREAAFVALRGYYETERSGDPRIRSLISQALLRARDAMGTRYVMAPAGSLYFTGSWLGHDRLERIYGPFGKPEFIADDPPEDADECRLSRDFYEWLGVGSRPRIDERRADQRDLYPLNNLSRHPHRIYGELWTAWQEESSVKGGLICDQGHTTNQQLRASFGLDRFPELMNTSDYERLSLLWQEICAGWPSYEGALEAEFQCHHGWHTGASIRHVPSLLDYMLRNASWVPCIRGGERTLVTPTRAWRITPETPLRVAERVDILDPSLDVPGSASAVAALGVVDAARPAAENLVALLRELSEEVDGPDAQDTDEQAGDVGRDVQLAARWAMRTLNDALESGARLDAPVPLLARRRGHRAFTGAPFVADDPLLAETWEPMFPILDADRDLHRLRSALRLRNLDAEVRVVPDPHRPLPDRRLEIERRISEAKPYLAAVVIDQVPSRQNAVIRGLSRLEVAVCEDLVLRYELDGETRERTDAVSYIAVRIEQDGSVRRRIGTAHLEIDPHTAAPHWYAFGPQLAQFLDVPNLGDTYALLLGADRSSREQYLAAKRISPDLVEEARLELAQPEDEGIIEDLLATCQEPLHSGADDGAPPSRAETTGDLSEGEEPGPEDGRESAQELELPRIDFDSLSIRDAPVGSAIEAEGEGRGASRRLGLGPSGPFDHEAAYRLRRRIGNRGEEAVFEAERRRMLSLGHDPGLVVWRSRDSEFAPYDIESQDEDGQLIYIEVKSTTSDDPSDPFEISDSELLFALQKRSRYYIYRVTSAHTPIPRIERYQDPVGRLHNNTAYLRLSGARLAFTPAASSTIAVAL